MTSIILFLQDSEEGDESDGRSSLDSATVGWIAEEKVAEIRSKANDNKASSKRKSVKEPKPKKETKKAQLAREKAEKASIEAAAAAGTAAGELAAAATAGAAAGAAAGALAGAASAALLNQDQQDNEGIASGDDSGKTSLLDCDPIVQGSRAKQPAKKLAD